MPVVVHGMRELQAAFARSDKESKRFVRAALRDVAEPIRREAETNAAARIPRMARSPRWSRMRTGLTRQLVYVAPRQKGTRGRGRGRRPNFANLLMDRAMEPALDRHEHDVVNRLEQAMDLMADRFNGGR